LRASFLESALLAPLCECAIPPPLQGEGWGVDGFRDALTHG
jgi:hypothetical protein